MSRWVYLLGLGIVAVGLGLAFTDWVLSLQPGVTEVNVKRIKKGMTMEEVVVILAGEGLSGNRPWRNKPGEWAMVSQGAFDTMYTYHHWIGRDGYACVTFVRFSSNERDRVDEARFERTERPSPFSRLRSWLGW